MENSKENKKLKNKSYHKVKLLNIYPKELKTTCPKGIWIYCIIIYHTQDIKTTCVHQKIKKDVVYIDMMEFY